MLGCPILLGSIPSVVDHRHCRLSGRKPSIVVTLLLETSSEDNNNDDDVLDKSWWAFQEDNDDDDDNYRNESTILFLHSHDGVSRSGTRSFGASGQ